MLPEVHVNYTALQSGSHQMCYYRPKDAKLDLDSNAEFKLDDSVVADYD